MAQRFVVDAGAKIHRLERFDVIEQKGDDMRATYRDREGWDEVVQLDAGQVRLDVLGAPVVTAAPGHHVLRRASNDPADTQLHRISVVGWYVTSVCAFPVTVDFSSTSSGLWDEAVEFPDGHVEYVNLRFDSVEEYCRKFGYISPLPTATAIPEGTALN